MKQRPVEIHCCTKCGASSRMPRTIEDASKFRCPNCSALLGPGKARKKSGDAAPPLTPRP